MYLNIWASNDYYDELQAAEAQPRPQKGQAAKQDLHHYLQNSAGQQEPKPKQAAAKPRK